MNKSLLLLSSLFLLIASCKISNDENTKKGDTPNQPLTRTNNDSLSDNKLVSDRYNSYLDSIPYSDNIKSKISIEIIKCKLLKGIDIPYKKYYNAELLSKYKYNTFDVYLFKLNCLAGASCSDFYLSTLNKSFELKGTKLLAKETAEGENNITIHNFKFNKGNLEFEVFHEYYSDESDDYIEETKKKYYIIGNDGEIKIGGI
ncbi:hypothetical protein [Tenacibaculum sp. 190524A05c]|uniref:hypothetical protein n=1 Tax=Tenacibaculum platacis TaxID=3137852 RepID=UPI0031FB7354